MRLLVLALLLACTGSALTSSIESVGEELFLQWGPQHGISGAENLMFMQNGLHGARGLAARKSFAAQEEILRLPLEMTISVDSTPWELLWKELRRRGPGALRNGLKPHHKDDMPEETIVQMNLLALYLCHLIRYPDTHKWSHYILTLPARETMTHLLFFTNDELDEMRGTALHLEAETMRKEVKSNYQFWRDLLADRYKHLFLAPLSQEEYIYAYVIVVSRDFGVDNSAQAVVCLMPFNDLANHVNPDKNNYVYQKGGVALSVAPGVKSIEAGEELFNTYGPQPNYNLMKFYGFSYDENPYDALYLMPPITEPQSEWKMQLRTEAIGRELAMRPGTIADSLGMLRILLCTDARVVEMLMLSEKFKEQVMWGEILEPGLELRVLDWAQRAVSNPLEALIGRPDDIPVYYETIENNRIAAAIMYRSNESRFLRRLLAALDVWEYELTERGVIPPRVTQVEVGDYDHPEPYLRG